MAWIISIVLFGITSVCAGFYSGNWRNIQNTPWRLVKKIYDTYIWCVILIYIGWRMQGWWKGQSHILQNCNNGPEETPVQGDCSYILTPRATGAARPSPAGPECKKYFCKLDECIMLIFLSEKSAITFGEGCMIYFLKYIISHAAFVFITIFFLFAIATNNQRQYLVS